MFDVSPILLVAALATSTGTPRQAPTATDTVLASVITPLVRTGDRVRLHVGGELVEGSAGWLGPQGIVLAPESCACTSTTKLALIPWSRIEGIERRTPHGASAARAGATIGCLAGVAVSMSVGSSAHWLGGQSSHGGSMLVAGVTGAIAGACVGGLIGGAVNALASPWTMVFEHR